MMHRMLVVDDEETVRWALRELFMQDGWEVHGAADGTDATRLLGQNDYDFMITDLRMPGRSGVDVLREARQRNPRMGIMILTGYGSLETAIEAVRFGAWDYVTKPCDVPYIRQRIGEFVESVGERTVGPTEHGRLAEGDLTDFMAGAGTHVLPPSQLAPEDQARRTFALLERMFADLGFGLQRRAELMQFCVEAAACLDGGGRVRAGLLKGHALVCITGWPPCRETACKMLGRVSDEFKLDVRVVEASGAWGAILCERVSDESPRAVPRWDAHADHRPEGARKAS